MDECNKVLISFSVVGKGRRWGSGRRLPGRQLGSCHSSQPWRHRRRHHPGKLLPLTTSGRCFSSLLADDERGKLKKKKKTQTKTKTPIWIDGIDYFNEIQMRKEKVSRWSILIIRASWTNQQKQRRMRRAGGRHDADYHLVLASSLSFTFHASDIGERSLKNVESCRDPPHETAKNGQSQSIQIEIQWNPMKQPNLT